MAGPREKKGYARKRELGLVPHYYDKGSKRFEEGAWKNHTSEMRQSIRRALQRSSHVQVEA